MTRAICKRDSEVRHAAATTAGLGEELMEHVESCARCRQAVELGRLMRQAAARRQAAERLPSAGLIWWRSRIAQRLAGEEAEARATTRPLSWLQALALGLFVAGLLFAQGHLLPTLAEVGNGSPAGPWLALAALGLFPVSAVLAALWLAMREG